MRHEWTFAAIVCFAVVLGTGAGRPAQSNGGRAAQPQSESRDSLIARAAVWRPVDVPSMDVRSGPSGTGSFPPGATVTCDYLDKALSGASPKFACRLADGGELKVKYGGTNGEVYGEVAASRLLWALGFGADRMYSVRVVCRGCPTHVGGTARQNGDRILDPAAVERKSGRELAGQWDWKELDRSDEEAGGAPRAHRDALKLLAVFLQHSDSKAQNQRIICLDEPDTGERCASPLMMLQDVGITFGRAGALNQQPRASVHLDEWSRVPIWRDPHGCVGNLSGSWTGTLKYPVISDEGRQFLGGLLMQLSDQQVRGIFEAARVHLRPRVPGRGRSGFASAEEWADVFRQKRAEIVDRRCA